jgi:hypothetical protein
MTIRFDAIIIGTGQSRSSLAIRARGNVFTGSFTPAIGRSAGNSP